MFLFWLQKSNNRLFCLIIAKWSKLFEKKIKYNFCSKMIKFRYKRKETNNNNSTKTAVNPANNKNVSKSIENLSEIKTNSLKREPKVTSPKVRFEDDGRNGISQHYVGQKDYLDCIRAVVVSFWILFEEKKIAQLVKAIRFYFAGSEILDFVNVALV